MRCVIALLEIKSTITLLIPQRHVQTRKQRAKRSARKRCTGCALLWGRQLHATICADPLHTPVDFAYCSTQRRTHSPSATVLTQSRRGTRAARPAGRPRCSVTVSRHAISQQPDGLLAASPSELSTPYASLTSKRSRFITRVHALQKSATKACLASSHA